MKAQLIYMQAGWYEVADGSNSVEPHWPVDDNGRMRWPEFEGQRVAYTPRTVDFGFLARKCNIDESRSLNSGDVPEGYIHVANGDSGWYYICEED